MKPAVACLALLASCATPRPPAPAGVPSGASATATSTATAATASAPPVAMAPAPARPIPVSPIEGTDSGPPAAGVILQVAPVELKWQATSSAGLFVRLTNEAVDCLWVDARMLFCDDRRCELRPWLFDPAGKRAGALYWAQIQPAGREDYRALLRGQSIEATADLTFGDYDFHTPGRYTLRLAYQDPVVPPPPPPPGCVTLDGKAVSNPISIDR